jgi:gp16 family phage-associated protein
MTSSKLLTPEQVKQRFYAAGVTFTQWAKDRGYKRRDVYLVLNGQSKARFGKSHRIAVELGLKAEFVGADELSVKPTTVKSTANTQKRAAA